MRTRRLTTCQLPAQGGTAAFRFGQPARSQLSCRCAASRAPTKRRVDAVTHLRRSPRRAAGGVVAEILLPRLPSSVRRSGDLMTNSDDQFLRRKY